MWVGKLSQDITMTRSSALFVLLIAIQSAFCDYWSDRRAFVDEETLQSVGGSVKLDKNEEIANYVLMKHKNEEITRAKANLKNFAPSRHFFQSKSQIEASEVFKIIKQIPKGAVLHVHDTSLASTEVIFNLTFTNNLYTCWEKGRLKFKFFVGGNVDKTCQWMVLEKLRKQSKMIDDIIMKEISLVTDNPYQTYPDTNSAWSAFKNIFGVIDPILTYVPIWKQYFYSGLKEFYDDNIRYVEIRSTLPDLYDGTEKIYTPLDVIRIYKETLEVFKRNYPDFLGARIIYAPPRSIKNDTMRTYVKTMRRLKTTFPDLVAGFDLVGQEDLGQPLINFIDELQSLKKINVSFFFHSGETDWYGSVDENLVDAILLGTKRIGHGFALSKHPKVLEEVLRQKIGIEICPISNQVLRLVDDLRNHPASSLIAQGFPVVISNDDPSFWGAKGVSYDWYMAFMGLAGEKADLRFLKQIAINSIEYSGMKPDEKNNALLKWQKDWQVFILNLINNAEDYSVILH